MNHPRTKVRARSNRKRKRPDPQANPTSIAHRYSNYPDTSDKTIRVDSHKRTRFNRTRPLKMRIIRPTTRRHSAFKPTLNRPTRITTNARNLTLSQRRRHPRTKRFNRFKRNRKPHLDRNYKRNVTLIKVQRRRIHSPQFIPSSSRVVLYYNRTHGK